MSSCLRGSSFFRRRDSFEEEDVGGKGVVKKIPIEMKQRRNLATSLRSVGSFGPKRQKGASLRSALSVELDGQETEKVKKEFEMYRLNKENEITNLKKKEQKLENENRRLRGELQAMQKTVAKLLYERDEAYIHEQQALERAATFEADREKIQRQFKIFREGKEEELQTILRTKRELERRLGSNRGRPGGNNNCNAILPLNNIVETEISGNHVGGEGNDSALPLTEASLNQMSGNHRHRNSVDWWMMGQSPCFEREPSIGSLTQLNTSMTLPAGYSGGVGGERTLLGSTLANRKVSSTSSLFGRGTGVGAGGEGVGLGAAEIVSASQFGTPAGLDVGGGEGDGVREDWIRMNAGLGGGSLTQSRNSQGGFEPRNPSFGDDSATISSSTVLRLYVSAPSDSQEELALFQNNHVQRLKRMCAQQGRTLLFAHLPPDEMPEQSSDTSSLPVAEPAIDIEVSAVLHLKLPKAAAIFLSFLNQRLDTFTKDEIHYGFLQKKEQQLLGAVFCFREAYVSSSPSMDLSNGSFILSELNSLKDEVIESDRFSEERKKTIFCVKTAEEAVDEAGKAIDLLLRQSLGISEHLDQILSEEEVEMDAVNAPISHDPVLGDRESLWMTRLVGTSGLDLLGDLEHQETLRHSLDSICELGFESHYQELTSHLSSAGPLPPLLICGQPGTGKSLLLAKWLSLIIEEKKVSHGGTPMSRFSFHPHHQFSPLVLYHSVAESPSVSGVPHNAIYRFTAKLLDHLPRSLASSLGHITSNPSRLLQEFPKLLESVSSRLPGGVILILDHADRFQDAETQLSWLLDPLPVDVRVFVAADEENCPKAWKSWPTLTVQPLSNNQIRELLVFTLKTTNTSLNADLLSLIQRHCRSPQTTTPLYVFILAAFLCWKATFEPEIKATVVEALEKSNCVELMKHVLKEVDGEFDGRIVSHGFMKKILGLVFASRSGVSENDMFEILSSTDEGKGVACHNWSVISDILTQVRILHHRGGLLIFANPQAREAVCQHYLLTPESVVNLRQSLITFHRQNLNVRDPRTVDELPWLLFQIGDRHQLKLCLRKVEVFVNLFARGRTSELLRFWSVVVGANDKVNALSTAYIEELKKAADKAEMGGGDDTTMSLTRVAAIYEALGRFFRCMAFFDHALRPLERALELRESIDPDSAEVGRSLVQLAQLNSEWRKYSTAEALFRNALELFEGRFGADHLEVASALEAMAMLYQRQGKHDVARPLQRRSDSIKLKKRRERIETSRARSAAVGQRRFGETIGGCSSLDRTGLKDIASRLPEAPVSLATTTMNIGHAKQSTAERQKQIASTFFNLGVRESQQNKHANALPLFQGALTVFEGALGQTHPLVAKTLRNLALVKFHLGENEAAADFYRRAIQLRENQSSDAFLSSQQEMDRRKMEDVAKLRSDSRRSSSDTMSTIKVGDGSHGHQRAASTR